jgi:RNA polymerase sigma-70 factor (ECF subfamily)
VAHENSAGGIVPAENKSAAVKFEHGPASNQKPAESQVAELSERYLGRLRMFAARRVGDKATAEDVAQEALRRILEALRGGRVRDDAAIAGFAFETVRNLCMHRGRSRQREERALDRFAGTPATEPPDVLTTLIDEERRREVRAALTRLEDDDRRLLMMSFVDTRSSDDIGREFGLTPGAVRVRRHRALKRLSACLGVTTSSDREQE